MQKMVCAGMYLHIFSCVFMDVKGGNTRTVSFGIVLLEKYGWCNVTYRYRFLKS